MVQIAYFYMVKSIAFVIALTAYVALSGTNYASYHMYYQHIGCPADSLILYQNDFDQGTVVLDTAGCYCLGEDIKFFPNSEVTLKRNGKSVNFENIGRVLSDQMTDPPTYGTAYYNPMKYGVGFFAAIAIAGDEITLDLNGFTISQAPEFALLQRFYSNIEIGDQPFVGGQGPAPFGSLTTGNGVVIRNGSIGVASHHCIHGNGATHVKIQNITC
jgi:hypothetical protein